MVVSNPIHNNKEVGPEAMSRTMDEEEKEEGWPRHQREMKLCGGREKGWESV